MLRILPVSCFFAAYFAGAPLVIASGCCALFSIVRKYSFAGITTAAFFFTAAGYAVALRDARPVVEVQNVLFADKDIIRLENGLTFRHEGTLIPKEGDEIRFTDSAIVRGEKGVPFLSSFEISTERSLRSRLAAFVRERSSSTLLLAFATGKRTFSLSERTDFLKTGTMHIVAISAFHIGMLFLFLNLLSRLLALFQTIPPRTLFFFMLFLKVLALLWYLSLTGWCTPTVRAASFVVLLDLFLTAGFALHPIHFFLLSLVVTATVIPKSLTSWSFIMSAISVFAVVSLWHRIPRSSFLSILVLSLVINFFFIPISAELTGFLPGIAPIANLITIPLATILLLCLLPCQALFPFFPSAAEAFLIPADALARVITKNLEYISSLSDYALIPLRQVEREGVLIFYAAAAVALLATGTVKRIAVVVLLASSIPFFISLDKQPTVEKIRSLPGEAYCIHEGSGNGRIVETRRYTFSSDYVTRKFDMIPVSLERDLSQCGVLQVTSFHLRGVLPRSMTETLLKRPRFSGASFYRIESPPSNHPEERDAGIPSHL